MLEKSYKNIHIGHLFSGYVDVEVYLESVHYGEEIT
jgi:hypothetical protein